MYINHDYLDKEKDARSTCYGPQVHNMYFLHTELIHCYKTVILGLLILSYNNSVINCLVGEVHSPFSAHQVTLHYSDFIIVVT